MSSSYQNVVLMKKLKKFCTIFGSVLQTLFAIINSANLKPPPCGSVGHYLNAFLLIGSCVVWWCDGVNVVKSMQIFIKNIITKFEVP